MSTEAQVAIFRALAEKLSVEISDIAAEEIKEAEESTDSPAYEAGYQSGIESACEDMYSWDSVQEECDSAVEKAREQWEENDLEDARGKSYEAGYRDAQRGKAPEYDFVNGIPSFLL